MCGGICSSAKELGAKHIPVLFHCQYEISKATAAPLSSQERELKKATLKKGGNSKKAEKALEIYNLKKYGLEERKERNQEVSNLKKVYDFQTIEELIKKYDGRLHWGKFHTYSQNELKTLSLKPS